MQGLRSGRRLRRPDDEALGLRVSAQPPPELGAERFEITEVLPRGSVRLRCWLAGR